MDDGPVNPCDFSGERRACAMKVDSYGNRLAVLETKVAEHHDDLQDLVSAQRDSVAQQIQTNKLLADLVRRPEFREAMTAIDGKYVSKARYQLIEAAVITWIGLVTVVVATAAFKFLGLA